MIVLSIELLKTKNHVIEIYISFFIDILNQKNLKFL